MGIRIAGILLCGLLFMGSCAEASGEFPYKNAVLAHRAPDGSIGFVAGPDLPVLKAFAPDGAAPVYYIRFGAEKSSFKKANAVHARAYADGQPIALEPVGSEADMHDSKWFSGWYRLSAVDIARMGKAAEFSFQLVDGDKILWEKKGKLKTAEAMQKLAAADPSQYLREGNIRAQNADDSVQEDSRPRVFLPDVSPEVVQGRIYGHLEELKKDKEMKSDWRGFHFFPNTNEHIVSVIGDSIGDQWPLVTFETIPYHGGTLLAMMKDQQGYLSFAKSYYTVGMMTPEGFVVTSTGIWRSLADQWDGFLNDLYREMSPHAVFPFEISYLYKKDEGNHFFIKTSSDAAFSEGDEILHIDGASVAWYKPNELRLLLLQKQGNTAFHIRRANGTEHDISVMPKIYAPNMTAERMEQEGKSASFEGKEIDAPGFSLITQGNYPALFGLMDESYRETP